MKQIKINITEEELQELQEGKTFNWNFEGYDIEIYKGEDFEEDENA